MPYPNPMRAISRIAVLVIVALSAIDASRAEDVPYVPTPPEVVAAMLKAASTGPRDTVIDLGSGDGRIPIAAVTDFGARRALGVEINPRLVMEARRAAERAGVADRVAFREGNLFDFDFSGATVLTMYLLPEINLRLRPQILAMRPGARIVSHEFTMGDWMPDASWMPLDERHPQGPAFVYLWVVPADVAGAWRWEEGSRRFAMTIRQTYQAIDPVVTADGTQVAVETATLSGDRIRVVLAGTNYGRVVYDGRVDQDAVSGIVVRADGGGAPWSAWRAPRRR
jgi:SAM-dependent methyltransferase